MTKLINQETSSEVIDSTSDNQEFYKLKVYTQSSDGSLQQITTIYLIGYEEIKQAISNELSYQWIMESFNKLIYPETQAYILVSNQWYQAMLMLKPDLLASLQLSLLTTENVAMVKSGLAKLITLEDNANEYY